MNCCIYVYYIYLKLSTCDTTKYNMYIEPKQYIIIPNCLELIEHVVCIRFLKNTSILNIDRTQRTSLHIYPKKNKVTVNETICIFDKIASYYLYITRTYKINNIFLQQTWIDRCTKDKSYDLM